jgi:hypothetical protein
MFTYFATASRRDEWTGGHYRDTIGAAHRLRDIGHLDAADTITVYFGGQYIGSLSRISGHWVRTLGSGAHAAGWTFCGIGDCGPGRWSHVGGQQLRGPRLSDPMPNTPYSS